MINFLQVFARLSSVPSSEDMKTIERFVCSMYGRVKVSEVNEARLDMFLSTYKPKSSNAILVKQMKSVDSTSLPPCKNVLTQKIKRTAYITQIWRNATLGCHFFDLPTSSGWILKEGSYRIHWFDGDVAPRVIDVVQDDTIEDGKEYN